MIHIYFLASNNPIELPEAFLITEYDYWHPIVKSIFTMPYLYEVSYLEHDWFYVYLDKHLEIGDTIELFYMPNQHWHKQYISEVHEKPELIHINIGSRTYQNQLGIFKLNAKSWVEELRHRMLVTERGVTTIVKYEE